MSDGPDNLVLLTLRRIEVKLDRLADDMADIKIRLTKQRNWGEVGSVKHANELLSEAVRFLSGAEG